MKNEIVICGAGIAGISAAYFLVTKYGINDIIIVDPRSPLSLTSDQSTECYRNWWPGPDSSMIELMNRSITLIDRIALQNNNRINLNRRGYLYLSKNKEQSVNLQKTAEEISRNGGGELRVHGKRSKNNSYTPSPPEGLINSQVGADLILDPAIINEYYPYLNHEIRTALHVRKAGWLSAQQLGSYLYEQIKASGVKYIRSSLTAISTKSEKISSIDLIDGTTISTNKLVIAAGPFLQDVCKMINVHLPVFNELHLKVAIPDIRNIIPRESPLLIWNDPQTLSWSSEERELIEEFDELSWMLHKLPAGVHMRPEGSHTSQIILGLWEYKKRISEPIFPIPIDHEYPDIVLRGLCKMIPDLDVYTNKIPSPRIDGGYYTKTKENRPLIGRLPVEGAYIIGALSGFGIMASCGAGELLATHMTNNELPNYAKSFQLDRYDDPDYTEIIMNMEHSGQL